MTIRVECRDGDRDAPEPHAFWLGVRRVAVLRIVDRWFGPAQCWFRVEADDGHLYVLRWDEATQDWELAAFTTGTG
ncbi:hypothetical protein QTH97_28255 [Variovorax sp. J22R24]|uniref:hypothetical protein n=1 Tax=Variovorax gracilis TaxID=3053502 RepID=UPI002578E93A|nr:hypothetical protein [Variovorax sp. J22R24]MDM0108866.1 hypothetical protein [Variovorax sp. J22R24]